MIGSDRQGNVSRAARLRRESVMLASGPAFRIQEETNNCVLLFFFFFRAALESEIVRQSLPGSESHSAGIAINIASPENACCRADPHRTLLGSTNAPCS